jgi:predicted transcriptional regulator
MTSEQKGFILKHAQDGGISRPQIAKEFKIDFGAANALIVELVSKGEIEHSHVSWNVHYWKVARREPDVFQKHRKSKSDDEVITKILEEIPFLIMSHQGEGFTLNDAKTRLKIEYARAGRILKTMVSRGMLQFKKGKIPGMKLAKGYFVPVEKKK